MFILFLHIVSHNTVTIMIIDIVS